MNNLQLIIVVMMPTLAVLVGILVNQYAVNSLRTDMHASIDAMRSEMHSSIEALRSDTQASFASIREDIRILTGKVIELSDRVTRLEERTRQN